MQIKCKCGQVLSIAEDMVGKVIACPTCGLRSRVRNPQADKNRPVAPIVVNEPATSGTAAEAPPSAPKDPLEELASALRPAASPSSRRVPATHHAPREMAAESSESVFLWVFVGLLGYLTMLVFLPWVSVLGFKINAVSLLRQSFKEGRGAEILNGLAILAYMGALVGGWITVAKAFPQQRIPKMTVWFGLAAGVLLLFFLGMQAKDSPISIIDVISPTFYLGFAAAVVGFVLSLTKARGRLAGRYRRYTR